MAKDLPYFRFTVSEWLNDDISLESYHVQGVFASVCAFYWFQDCSITKAKLEKRFSDALEEIEYLIELGIIKEIEDDFISIKFLDEQYDILSEKRKKRVEAGRKGGLSKSSNAKAMLKQCSSYKDKDKDKDNDKDVKDFVQFLKLWNEVNGCNLRMTDNKRDQIKERLRTYSEEELKRSIQNRAKDDWINGEGRKFKEDWNSFWRNDEKPERYLKEKHQESLYDTNILRGAYSE
jgi:hypothetical protein